MQASLAVLSFGNSALQSSLQRVLHVVLSALHCCTHRVKSVAARAKVTALGQSTATTAATATSLRTPLENFGIPLLLAHPDVKELRLTAMYRDPYACQGSFGTVRAEAALFDRCICLTGAAGRAFIPERK
jgi:hypothetical protein